MTSLDPELPGDIASCHAVIRQLRGELHEAQMRVTHLEALAMEHRETIEDQNATIKQLSDDNTLLKRNLFGPRRERFEDPTQTFLFDIKTLDPELPVGDQEEPPQPRKKRSSKGRQRRVFPDLLPREELRHELNDEDIPEEMRDNPQARRFFKKLGEYIELIPMQIKVIEEYQEIIALENSDATTTIIPAKRPPSLIRSFAGPSLLAYLTVSRFADHIPYYRLENILSRSGVSIDRSTQWRWMRRLAEGVTPLVDLMWDRAIRSAVLCMDETPVRELGGPGTTQKGYLWCGVGDKDHPYDCFFYSSNRRMVHPASFLANYCGYLVADAYVAYERLDELPNVIKSSCWVHGRRKFDECHHLGATEKTCTALAYFRQLSDLEDQFKLLSPEERWACRQQYSRPIVNAFYDWLCAEQKRQLPKSKLAGAINYMLTRWESFTRFLEHGLVPMDNNAAERALKYPILGRKAWLFVGNPEAGETAAKLITLTKTCNRLHIDPFAYLQDVYARLPTLCSNDLSSLLPDRWLKEHPQHLMPQRVQEAIERAQRAHERRAARRRAAA